MMTSDRTQLADLLVHGAIMDVLPLTHLVWYPAWWLRLDQELDREARVWRRR